MDRSCVYVCLSSPLAPSVNQSINQIKFIYRHMSASQEKQRRVHGRGPWPPLLASVSHDGVTPCSPHRAHPPTNPSKLISEKRNMYR